MQSGAKKSTLSSATATMTIFSALCLVMGALVLINQVDAMQMVDQGDNSARSSPSATLAVVENPELTARVLENLLKSILYSSIADIQPTANAAQKRGLDLGISRGFSGSQAGKHLIGLSAASFANGPGRR